MHFSKRLLIIGIFFTSASAFAYALPSPVKIQNYSWSALGSIGYTHFQNMYNSDGDAFIGRFAIAKKLVNARSCSVGVEMGLQTGNTMRLDVSQDVLDLLGGAPIQFIAKPMLDLLAVLNLPVGYTPLSIQIKGGGAFRQLQYQNGTSVNSLSEIDGEVQAGIGYQITPRANLAVLYQGIFGGNPNFTINALNDTAHISNIPSQNGVLISLGVTI